MALEDAVQYVCADCSSFGTCKYVKNLVQVNNYLVDGIKANQEPFKTVAITLKCRKWTSREKPLV